MKFNVNNWVKIRLNDTGREILKEQHKEFCARFPGFDSKLNFLPKEDADGWSNWQLWSLMQSFGPHISLGVNPPFDTEIIIDDIYKEL